MSRWAPDAALRLESAALELFSEQGYANTTVPQIAARAGLTTRTFFRHFAVKRDVLFLREREFPEVVEGLLATAPADLAPIDLVMFGFESIAAQHFSQWRQSIAARQAIIRSDAQLRERELLKSAMLADAIESAITKHGVDPSSAALLAPFGVMVFDVALTEWLQGDDRPLVDVLRDKRSQLHALLG